MRDKVKGFEERESETSPGDLRKRLQGERGPPILTDCADHPCLEPWMDQIPLWRKGFAAAVGPSYIAALESRAAGAPDSPAQINTSAMPAREITIPTMEFTGGISFRISAPRITPPVTSWVAIRFT